jgi:hypothetical protein
MRAATSSTSGSRGCRPAGGLHAAIDWHPAPPPCMHLRFGAVGELRMLHLSKGARIVNGLQDTPSGGICIQTDERVKGELTHTRAAHGRFVRISSAAISRQNPGSVVIWEMSLDKDVPDSCLALSRRPPFMERTNSASASPRRSPPSRISRWT